MPGGCGPSNSQKNIEGGTQSLFEQFMSNYSTNFANSGAILGHLNSVAAPIVAAGPSQEGFSSSEKAALNTQAIDSAGASAANVERAIGNETAGRNDSGNLAESGTDQALKENALSSAAGQLASTEEGITEADYATGRSNFTNAVNTELGVAGQYNPNATGSLAVSGGNSAFGESTQIQQEEGQEAADIAGGITSIAGDVLTGGASGALSGFGGGGGSPVSGVDLGGFADLGAF